MVVAVSKPLSFRAVSYAAVIPCRVFRHLEHELAYFPRKGPGSKYFRFAGHVDTVSVCVRV